MTLRVQIATSSHDQEKGLSGRSRVPRGTGMWFPLGHGHREGVWMAGMKVGLDIAWVKNDRIAEIRTLPPCRAHNQQDCPKWYSPAPDALLETTAGGLSTVAVGSGVKLSEAGTPHLARTAAQR